MALAPVPPRKSTNSSVAPRSMEVSCCWRGVMAAMMTPWNGSLAGFAVLLMASGGYRRDCANIERNLNHISQRSFFKNRAVRAMPLSFLEPKHNKQFMFYIEH